MTENPFNLKSTLGTFHTGWSGNSIKSSRCQQRPGKKKVIAWCMVVLPSTLLPAGTTAQQPHGFACAGQKLSRLYENRLFHFCLISRAQDRCIRMLRHFAQAGINVFLWYTPTFRQDRQGVSQTSHTEPHSDSPEDLSGCGPVPPPSAYPPHCIYFNDCIYWLGCSTVTSPFIPQPLCNTALSAVDLGVPSFIYVIKHLGCRKHHLCPDTATQQFPPLPSGLHGLCYSRTGRAGGPPKARHARAPPSSGTAASPWAPLCAAPLAHPANPHRRQFFTGIFFFFTGSFFSPKKQCYQLLLFLQHASLIVIIFAWFWQYWFPWSYTSHLLLIYS